uniref:transcription factor IIIB 50 kDa subunit n=1 Tax=Euleptes europaea TaxID=460621 RepID=UPI00253FD6A7|nr:transcription factor IIIB 50 kDa subunit [Euleptes europaea]
MSGQRKCPNCGSSGIVEDSHYGQNQLVCVDCGIILTEGLLTTTYTDEAHFQAVTYSRSTGQSEQQTRCLLRGSGRVRDLCEVLRLPSLFKDTAVAYYEQAFQHSSFRWVSLEKKEILAGCCVFAACRQHNWPLTMGSICSLLYAEKELFAKTYLSFLKELKLDVPALSLVDLVKTHLGSFRLFQDSSSVPSKFVEDMEKVAARTVEVVELASEAWLVTGRHPIPIVTAAAYLAWQSLRPAGRLTCTLSQFCKLAGTDLPPPAHQRLKELLDILLRMASELAWLRVLKVNKKSVAKYIADLLRHRRLLLQTAFCTGDSAAEDCLGDSAAEPPQATDAKTDAETERASVSGEKGQRSSKRPPLLPPCMLNPRKKQRTVAPSSELLVTGDEPILDSEIEQYLRTPEEKERFCKARAFL